MQFFLYFMPHFAQCFCTCVGSYTNPPLVLIAKTKGVNYAKNSNSHFNCGKSYSFGSSLKCFCKNVNHAKCVISCNAVDIA